MNNKIPLLAIVGFLGSGKTTLLNHLLKENNGLKIGVIVNDFGAINIDSMLVARQTDSQLELSNGCICCAVGEGGLDDAISQLAHAGSTLDYIVVEASGLAEPRDLANILVGSRNKYASLDSIVAVVDADTVLEQKEKHPDFFAQLEVADIIILNKVDLTTSKKLKEISGYLTFLNEKARIIETKHGVVDTRLLLDPEAAKKTESSGDQLKLTDKDHHDHEHLHDSYQTVSFETREPLDPKKFETFLASLDKNIYRMKGFLYFGMKGVEQKFVFQLVGNRHEMKLDDWRGKTPSTSLVAIGTDIEKKKLLKQLEALIDTSPEDIKGGMMDIFQYR